MIFYHNINFKFKKKQIGKTLGSSEYGNFEEDQKAFLSLLTEDEKNELIEMSRDENIFEKLVKSIAPSIFGLSSKPKFLLITYMKLIKFLYLRARNCKKGDSSSTFGRCPQNYSRRN